MWWLILGVLIGVGVYWMATRARFKLSWYEWLLGVLGLILVLYGIQNYAASLVELEPRAAGILLVMFGLPGVILAVIAGVLVWMRVRKEPAS